MLNNLFLLKTTRIKNWIHTDIDEVSVCICEIEYFSTVS